MHGVCHFTHSKVYVLSVTFPLIIASCVPRLSHQREMCNIYREMAHVMRQEDPFPWVAT